ncbi:hypothetical protein OZ411_28760 [Bradyrhizobium sp. Arg237L]|uniref:hypothetical protein n=1 Tax=Bradyrhizobium sp. Arg237L TaxID=3003352 RepID=UPI00249DDEF1|nr:hypothetical protein [Bradyrhizobium sp. Arg237L]MDI4236809.1 hypothetical protein [Bradyrhizobium sp. Arg237L]
MPAIHQDDTPVTEIDDGGAPRDAATAFFEKRGFAANAQPLGEGVDDIMKACKRVTQTRDDANPQWLDDAALRSGADRDVSLHNPERAVEAKRLRLREHAERRQFIERLLAQCAPSERLARVQTSLRRLHKVRSYDERALITASVDADLTALGARRYHVEDLLSHALRVSVRTAYTVLADGRALIADVLRHALPTQSLAVVQSLMPRGAKPNLRQASRRSLFDFKACLEAISRLSAQDQTLIAREIERRVALADLEAREGLDDKEGLQKLSHSMLDDLDAVERNDATTRRQLAKRSAAERRAIVSEWVSDAVDGITDADVPPCEAAVQDYQAAFEKLLTQHRMKPKRTKRTKRAAA